MKNLITLLFILSFIIGTKESLSQPGVLDSTFGQNGITYTAINTAGSSEIKSIQIQNDGKIIAAGVFYDRVGRTYFCLVRFNSDGTPDNTFGIEGIVITRIGETSRLNSVLVQEDGKIVAAGCAWNGTDLNFAVVRYNSNGEPDINFGVGGIVVTEIGEEDDAIQSIAIQEDGKIIAGGYNSNGTEIDFCLVRYNTDGSLDETFGTDGIVVTPGETSMDRIYSVAIQKDGKIVAAGYSDFGGDRNFALARYNSNGTLDNSFGFNGILITIGSGTNEEAKSVLIQSDGKIVAVGYSDLSGTDDFALARYQTNGDLDSTFGINGIVITAAAGDDNPHSAVIQEDGKIIAVGHTDFYGTEDFALVRYTSNGNLDTTFGDGGIVVTAVRSWDEAQSLAINNDGKIIAAGFVNDRGDSDFALVCYNSDGNIDNTFGKYGVVTKNIGASRCSINSANLQSVGDEEKIVVVGSNYNGNDYDFALARYDANGVIDNTFGSNGIVTTNISYNNDEIAYSGVVQGDGKIIAAGYSVVGSNSCFALVRYTLNGFPEKIVSTQIGASDSRAYSVAVQSDGKIIAAGNYYNGRNYDFALARYNKDLSLDNLFGTDGIVTTEIGTSDDQIESIIIQDDGKIVTAGYTRKSSDDYDFALVRYNSEGDIDLTFGEDGIVITDIFTNYDKANSIAVQNITGETDRKILAGGYTINAGHYDFALVRYNSNGIPDSSFGTNGIVTTQIGSSITSLAYSIAIQSDGKILVGGSTFNAGYCDFAIACYNPGGVLDNSFGTDGIITTQIGASLWSEIKSVLFQNDGKIIAAGYAVVGINSVFTLARYQGGEVTNIKDENPDVLPSSFTLKQNYPNPFNPGTILSFAIAHRSFVSLKVYDILGREVATLVNEEKQPGTYEVQ
ncbi:MAG: hypothetical protein P8Z35_12900, partial [Ignavibacteriaceae bacterium]